MTGRAGRLDGGGLVAGWGRGWPGLPVSARTGGYPLTAATPSAPLVPIQPAFSEAERLALAGLLAGYRGLTGEACALDLRQSATGCRACSLHLVAACRAGIEGVARDLEARGRARATVTRRLSTIAGFCRYAVEEELRSTRRPRPPAPAAVAGHTVTPWRTRTADLRATRYFA